jgi:hypothetical protein
VAEHSSTAVGVPYSSPDGERISTWYFNERGAEHSARVVTYKRRNHSLLGSSLSREQVEKGPTSGVKGELGMLAHALTSRSSAGGDLCGGRRESRASTE